MKDRPATEVTLHLPAIMVEKEWPWWDFQNATNTLYLASLTWALFLSRLCMLQHVTRYILVLQKTMGIAFLFISGFCYSFFLLLIIIISFSACYFVCLCNFFSLFPRTWKWTQLQEHVDFSNVCIYTLFYLNHRLPAFPRADLDFQQVWFLASFNFFFKIL